MTIRKVNYAAKRGKYFNNLFLITADILVYIHLKSFVVS